MAKVGIFGTILIYWLLHRAYCSARTPGNKPNIILIVLDDVGYGDFSSYGHPTQEINEVDKMAADGLRFTQWYATAALCTPSRAAILTGSYNKLL
jgi:arylsulfatase A-like enzyme